MSKAHFLTPESVKAVYPAVYRVFFEATDSPKRSDYESGRAYAKAMAEWIKGRNGKLEL